MGNEPLPRAEEFQDQAGAALVELAVGLMLFLVLVLGVLEFGYALFNWSRVAEATRAGVRTAIVNDPQADLGELLSECSEGTSGEVQAGPSDRVLASMKTLYAPLEEEQVVVTYRCSGTGHADRPTPVLTVTVEVQDVEHRLMVPHILGLETEVTLPAFASSRTSEDLETQPVS
ncbi:TadE/TadG family type IV pilus assembly protein [Thiohalorhabdus denitrificans]|uniref:Flp pilus assembly protein TadG n=1 Tax=Thiohalorhabdus denitrificans TaxID=381306 RepID=A0A1G5DLJ1_9GAMM|nr:TadE/TadG family type IV pilus assembly protein [Thiohalorhabdus denitrificans]SCY15575.1 Flp pilus assembly protein TadG [Thiohalorhabdus denitrificans]